MCGIAGYSLSPSARVDRTLAAQALLAAIAERGADAAGYAWRAPGRPVLVHKQPWGASTLLDAVEIAPDALQVLLHVRDYTKGHPTIPENNHPVRHGAVAGVHNGIIFNDDEVLAAHDLPRAHPRMTVDSEVIFALAEAYDSRAEVFEQLRGSMAAAWLDERRPGLLFLARGVGRPLWVGTARSGTYFASTSEALEVLERYAGLGLRKRELPEGVLVTVAEGREAARSRFTPNRAFEEKPLPAVRAPHEGAFCLDRLAALAAAAG